MEIPVGYCQINYKFTGTAVPSGAQVTLGALLDGIEDTPEAVATAAAAAWSTTIRNRQTTEVTLASVLVKFGPNATGASAENAVGLAATLAEASAPPNTSLLVRKITGIGGHAGRGRFYWPGVAEDEVGSNGFVTPSSLSSWQSEFDDFLLFLQGALLTPVVLHAEDSPLVTPTPITNLLVDPRVATQRRRLRR